MPSSVDLYTCSTAVYRRHTIWAVYRTKKSTEANRPPEYDGVFPQQDLTVWHCDLRSPVTLTMSNNYSLKDRGIRLILANRINMDGACDGTSSK